ncbi:hypothetical protein IMZ31_05270 [Pontibacillus sp. ALD_SL1]|uniref:hypothetical protein n=1 Tax=Pontibacillus sp. ALD_SL1 TaxID=2777185 RepID=UPI001A97787B|nr:hypothetical protein [Pontibacillus sp. ALD_SL1]QST00983.1 hypothetical protein IMZ31_05270 [Pontibacillus sp. ALD_SL1]
MNVSKWMKPIALSAATIVAGVLITRGQKDPKEGTVISDVIHEGKTFGGLTQMEINEIVSHTFRGVKAVIEGGALEYTFSSASGKQKPTARIEFDSAGELDFTFLSFPNAQSPRIFIKNLREAMNKGE